MLLAGSADRSFRPWCPVCETTSKPGSYHCNTCGLSLYPSERQLETLVALLRPRRRSTEPK